MNRGIRGTRAGMWAGRVGLPVFLFFLVKQPLWELTKKNCRESPVGRELGLVKHVDENEKENER